MHKNLLKSCLAIILVMGLILPWQTNSQSTSTTFTEPNRLWDYQCLDTMKFSRDTARQFMSEREEANEFIKKEIDIIKSFGANCLAVATPYDEEFIPILEEWVNAAHDANLKVWFRGNFSGWENWFDYPKFTNEQQHHTATRNFLQKHNNLLKPGDIFTPAPEAENGIIGNPWESEARKERLRKFVTDSYKICSDTLIEVGKVEVKCGYFSANGDVAEKVYNPDTIANTGGVVVIDHYIKTSQRMSDDIQRLAENQKANVAIGEFGGPIPDINGTMTEDEQEKFVRELLRVFYEQKDKITLINYWVLRGGSTTLINDDGTEREVVEAIKDYYQPGKLNIKVVNTLGQSVDNVEVKTEDGVQNLVTDEDGELGITLPAGDSILKVIKQDYEEKSESVKIMRVSSTDYTIELNPVDPSWWYWLRLKVKSVF